MSRIKLLIAVMLIGIINGLSIYTYTSQDSILAAKAETLEPSSLRLEFLGWMKQYHKNYANSEEFEFRFKQWLIRRDQVKLHNASGAKYMKKLNHLADLTDEEMNSLWGDKSIEAPQISDPEPFEIQENRSKDWNAQGAVTSVKSQGVCNSGYAFAAIGAIQGLYKIRNGNLLTFSPQQIIDCVHPSQKQSCYFGFIDQAFQYLTEQSALLDSDYPYQSLQKQCTPNVSLGVISIADHKSVESLTIQLMNAVERQPIAVYIDPTKIHDYDGGIITAKDCGEDSKHGVLVTGYKTTDSGDNYWIIKNSWSNWWGEYGYGRLQLGPNTCGILNSMSFPEF